MPRANAQVMMSACLSILLTRCNLSKQSFKRSFLFSDAHDSTMATNKLILEYPRGISLHVAMIGSDGHPVRSFAMGPDALIRLGPNLEFLGMSSGNIKTLVEMGGSESEEDEADIDDDDDDDDEGCDSEEAMPTESDESTTDADNTIDLVSESEDSGTSDESDADDNDDEIVVTYTVD